MPTIETGEEIRKGAWGAAATGLAKMPSWHYPDNQAWLELVMIAADLIALTKLIGFGDQPELARSEINAFRHRVLHVASHITRGEGYYGYESVPPGGGPTPSRGDAARALGNDPGDEPVGASHQGR